MKTRVHGVPVFRDGAKTVPCHFIRTSPRFKRRILSEETGLRSKIGVRSESENAQTRGCRSLPKIPKDPAERGRKEPELGKSTGSAALNCVIYISSPWFGCL